MFSIDYSFGPLETFVYIKEGKAKKTCVLCLSRAFIQFLELIMVWKYLRRSSVILVHCTKLNR